MSTGGGDSQLAHWLFRLIEVPDKIGVFEIGRFRPLFRFEGTPRRLPSGPVSRLPRFTVELAFPDPIYVHGFCHPGKPWCKPTPVTDAGRRLLRTA